MGVINDLLGDDWSVSSNDAWEKTIKLLSKLMPTVPFTLLVKEKADYTMFKYIDGTKRRLKTQLSFLESNERVKVVRMHKA